jgi:hypothetical protein
VATYVLVEKRSGNIRPSGEKGVATYVLVGKKVLIN